MSEEEIVNSFLRDKGFQQMVESEIGKVLRCVVNWETRKITIQSAKTGRELDIDAILAAYNKTLNQ